MTHVAAGVLRRFLDQPAAISAVDRAHLTSCPRCAIELGQAQHDRATAAAALIIADRGEPDLGPAQLDTAWVRFVERLAESDVAGSARPGRPGPRSRQSLLARLARRPVAAAVIAGLVIVGGGAAAAAQGWLQIFRTETVAPVSISAQDLMAVGEVGRLMALSAYGQLVQPTHPQLIDVPGAADAAARTGLTVPQVGALPTGVQGNPRYQILERQVVQFTFSAAKAAQTAAALGATLPPMPAGLDGSQLQLLAGPGMVLTWTQRSGPPTLMVAKLTAPSVVSQGAPLPVVRDYLLSLPGIPADLAAQLRTMTGDGTTLPIPVPANLATASQAPLGDATTTVVETKDRAAVAAIWAGHGVVEAVAGPLSREEVLAVAHDLH